MMDIWSWICELPSSDEWSSSAESEFFHIFELASSKPSGGDEPTQTIQLKAERTAGSNSEDGQVKFSVYLQGFKFHPFPAPKTIWVSDTCSLSSDKRPFLPLLLQLLQEIISRSPTSHNSICPRSQLQKLKPEPVAWVMDSHSPESFSSFFNLVFLARLFWLCACDLPAEVGSFNFESLLGPNVEAFSCKNASVLRTFLVTVGVDAELCFLRAVGYMLAKWLILREVGVGLQILAPLSGPQVGFSYAMEAHGLWVLKGYAPIFAMKLASSSDKGSRFPIVGAKESVLKYALAHQQLEATIQLEYSVGFFDGYIQVNARVDNVRLHVAKLGFNSNDDTVQYAEERHCVSRARVWVGPEVGATYVACLSLGRSTDNGERELEIQSSVKGTYEKSSSSQVKTRAKMGMRTRMKNWRWDQDVEGNAVIFDAVLYDNKTGREVSTCKALNDVSNGGSVDGNAGGSGFRKRYNGANRPFTKTGGVVFAGDQYGEGVGWRLSREMEGSVLKWRIGGQVWVSYWPNDVNSSYFEIRSVEWCDEVDLPLIPGKINY